MITAGLIERSLNHLLRQTPGAQDALRKHVGASVRFDLAVTRFDARIAEDGCFSEAAVEAPDAVVRTTATLLARLPLAGRDAFRHAEYSGDPALLHTLDRVFRQLEWDVEADLAPLLGDVAAHRLHGLGSEALAGMKQTLSALGLNVSEYLVEEAELMARGVDVARFNHDVDLLADDVARLDARLRRLETKPS